MADGTVKHGEWDNGRRLKWLIEEKVDEAASHLEQTDNQASAINHNSMQDPNYGADDKTEDAREQQLVEENTQEDLLSKELSS